MPLFVCSWALNICSVALHFTRTTAWPFSHYFRTSLSPTHTHPSLLCLHTFLLVIEFECAYDGSLCTVPYNYG